MKKGLVTKMGIQWFKRLLSFTFQSTIGIRGNCCYKNYIYGYESSIEKKIPQNENLTNPAGQSNFAHNDKCKYIDGLFQS